MVVRLYLLPALSMTEGNAVCTVEVWNIVKQFDEYTRWRFYGEWKNMYKNHSELRVRQKTADRDSKDIMRRLSVKTVSSLSGSIAKLAHANPLIIFSNAVNQIMAYDNLASIFVTSLSHCTVMSFDVLLFIVLDALASPNKQRLKDDGVNIADWLQSKLSRSSVWFD